MVSFSSEEFKDIASAKADLVAAFELVAEDLLEVIDAFSTRLLSTAAAASFDELVAHLSERFAASENALFGAFGGAPTDLELSFDFDPSEDLNIRLHLTPLTAEQAATVLIDSEVEHYPPASLLVDVRRRHTGEQSFDAALEAWSSGFDKTLSMTETATRTLLCSYDNDLRQQREDLRPMGSAGPRAATPCSL